MPEVTLTERKRQVAAFCINNGFLKTAGQIERIAIKAQKRAETMEYLIADDLIRSVLTYTDPTGDEAVRNVLAVAS